MTEKVASPAVAKTEVTKKVTPKSAAKPRPKATHPKTAEMVNAAIASLKERSGSSLQAIKKYMAGTYMIDIEKQAPFIKKYLKSAVESGTITQTKGKGASGSFKLAAIKTKAAKPKDKAAKPATAKKSPTTKKPVAKKTEGKKPAAKKTPAVGQKKKTTKDLSAKPPKPKTIKAKPAAKPAAKKAAKPAAAPKKTKATVAAPKPKKAAPKKAVAKK